MSESFKISEFLAGYLAEVEEHLAASNHNLLALDKATRQGKSGPRAVRELFRSLHTIKGLSAMVAAGPIVNIAHEMEALLRAADMAGGVMVETQINVLMRGVRAIEIRVASMRAGKEPAEPPSDLLAELKRLDVPSKETGDSKPVLGLELELLAKLTPSELEEMRNAAADGNPVLRLDFRPSRELAAQDVSISTILERLATVGEVVRVIPRGVAASKEEAGGVEFVILFVGKQGLEEIAEAAGHPQSAIGEILIGASRAKAAPDLASDDSYLEDVDGVRGNLIRVDVTKLDEALEGVAQLVVNRSKIEREAERLQELGVDSRPLKILLREYSRYLGELRRSIMRARLIPVADMLQRAPLIVRSLCKSSGKEVALTIDAGTTEIDKSVADRLMPLLVHLLRNAVDHAIESKEERTKLGKAREGKLKLSCKEISGNRLLLSLEDDGRGIDGAAIAQRCKTLAPKNDEELLAMLVAPGFSTLDEATHTSGRGMGLDIIHRIAVTDLGGKLQLSTTVGKGTCFRVEVGVSLTIIEAFTISCGGNTFVVPCNMVHELAEVDPAMVVSPPSIHKSGIRLLRHRSDQLPLYSLAELLGTKANDACRRKAIVLQSNLSNLAFEVDGVFARREIVVRPVEDPLVRVQGVTGSTDLGDGKPTLVLDLLALVPDAQMVGSPEGTRL